jgi:hypothetical protein
MSLNNGENSMDIRIINLLVLLVLLWSHWCISIKGFETGWRVLRDSQIDSVEDTGMYHSHTIPL